MKTKTDRVGMPSKFIRDGRLKIGSGADILKEFEEYTDAVNKEIRKSFNMNTLLSRPINYEQAEDRLEAARFTELNGVCVKAFTCKHDDRVDALAYAILHNLYVKPTLAQKIRKVLRKLRVMVASCVNVRKLMLFTRNFRKS